ncbi:pyridoxamine 5'-phosphate oxidase family protein [Aeromicrobium fastidiosum]|uniref:pyridoxamine 5'-phosphate oxidase family protein n=1 Tax=Aeromicrobium TaxID=2040 RepID=UPI0017838EE1|nr:MULTISPECIES: pyridoxamine 5'-phosphate oxidase family protein [Aeromicrobium]MBD8608863.1 pyridoxamine 5'-phosphate oxidase family protein [Aeromicrobium sp. CFBP 8757]MCL8250825.1 pyridoxamine 5'-phosphate oxidase family protein [Aeromicrobium fastidiosum]
MTDSTNDTATDTAKLVELTKDSRFVMLTTTDSEGHLVSRPMSRQDVDLDADLWFIATRDSRKVAHIRANPVVGVTVTSQSSWVSISGRAEIVDDVEKLKEYWSTFAEAWIPEGPEDPNAILIHVDAETAEYWDSPGGRVASLISLVKSKATGQPYDGGDHATVTDL